jgi:hypothetical protein
LLFVVSLGCFLFSNPDAGANHHEFQRLPIFYLRMDLQFALFIGFVGKFIV